LMRRLDRTKLARFVLPPRQHNHRTRRD